MAWLRWASAVTLVAACGGKAVIDGEPGSGGGGSGGSGSGGDPCACSVDESSPVCGVDGNTYEAACGERCVPVEIACEGACPCASCDIFEQRYAEALAEAKACNPALAVEQCTSQAGSNLVCMCPTAINPENGRALATMAELADAWKQSGCGLSGIECTCVPFASAICDPDTGLCADH
jgi:hypothetical protein